MSHIHIHTYISCYLHQSVHFIILSTLHKALTEQLIPTRVILKNLTPLQIAKNFPALHGIQTFLTHACQRTQPLSRWIQATPSHYISLKSISILPYHLCLCLASFLLPSGFLTTILQASVSSHAFYMSEPSHPWITFYEGHILWCSSICNFILLFTSSSEVQIMSSKSCSQLKSIRCGSHILYK